MKKIINEQGVPIQKLSIVTPCYNAEKYIKETIESVINNTLFKSSSIKLQYFICDGASTDNTVQVAREIIASINNENIELSIISEPDLGMYDALAKGLRLADGDICSYINAGDIYSPTAFEIVYEIFSTKKVCWLTGLQIIYNEKSHITDCLLPLRYRSRLIQVGMYGYGGFLPFIQQESTFWRRELHDAVDFQRLATFRYAGDFFLWKGFSSASELHVVSAWLGGFKRHKGQLSEDSFAYETEVRSIADKRGVMDYVYMCLEKALWYMPARLKKTIAGKMMYSFSDERQCYLNER